MLTRSNTIRLVTEDNDPSEAEREQPEHSSRQRSSPPAAPLPPTLLAFLQDTSDYPSQPSFAAAVALLKKSNSERHHEEAEAETETERDRLPRGLLATSTTLPSTATVTMTAPAGPVPVALPDHIRTTSPLSHLRHTLESYAKPKTTKATTTSETMATTMTLAKTAKPPTKSASYSTMPPASKRLGQQSTEDFVMRTSRSVAREEAKTSSTSSTSSSSSLPAQPQRQAPPPPKQNMPRYYTDSNGAQHNWQRPAPIKSRTPTNTPTITAAAPIVLRKKRAPGELFAALPGEVLELILDELKKLHYDFDHPAFQGNTLAGEHASCATCWMRDACAVAIAARKLLKYARVALYEAIEIVGPDAAHEHHHFYHRKEAREAPGSARLALLLRTLRDSPPIAAIVRSLKVPSLALYQAVPGIPAVGASGTIPDEYETLVASVVVSCPNLERVVGFHPTYDHAIHSRYVQALATRPRLKEMTWVLEPILSEQQQHDMRQQAVQRREEQKQREKHQRKGRGSRSRSISISAMIRPHAAALPPSPPASPPLGSKPGSPTVLPSACTPLDPRQTARFLNHHVNWQYLSTLTVHCKPGATLAPNRSLLVEAIAYLPRLQNLYLSHLPAAAFDDAALLSLPASLRKLALVHVRGISADGLSAFATRPNSRHLASLTLVHAGTLGGPGGLPALARALSKLDRLASLTFVHAQPPTLAPGETVWLFPYLASASLQRLHWDIPSSCPTDTEAETETSSADTILARSIAAGGFPSLRQLRAPADPQGVFQALCRPQERADLPGDRASTVPGFSHATPSTSPSPPLLSHAHRHSESSSTSSASVFSSALVHARTNSSSLSGMGSTKKPPSPPSSTDGRSYNTPHTNLQTARLAAQARINAARRSPRFLVTVTDEHGTLVDKFGTGSFIGTVGSPIAYHLLPDAGAAEDKGGLVDVEDYLGDGGEAASETGDSIRAARACSGQWNADWEAPQKKDRERWWHTERARWRGVALF